MTTICFAPFRTGLTGACFQRTPFFSNDSRTRIPMKIKEFRNMRLFRKAGLPLAVCLIAAVALAGGPAAPSARAADVEIRVSSGSFDMLNGTILLDVILLNQTGAAVTFGSFNLNLEVTPLTPRAIQFDSTTQPDMFTAPLATTYIFNGDSEGATQAAPYVPWTITSASGGTNNQYVFTDSVLTGSTGVVVADGTSRVMSRVKLLIGSAINGDSFTVSVVSGGAGTLLSDPNFTVIPYTVTNGTAFVPEPSTLALAALAAATIAATQAQTRRRPA